MSPLVEQHLGQITELCRKYGVKRLELFGSAACGAFDEATSDVDFFVEFVSYDTQTIADRWFGLQEELQRVLGRKVDLVSLRTLTNPYFIEQANRGKVTLYAA